MTGTSLALVLSSLQNQCLICSKTSCFKQTVLKIVI